MRLLIYEPTFRRLESRLARLPELDVLTMDDAGAIRRAGAAEAVVGAAPEVGWIDDGVSFSPVFATYVEALVGSPALRWVQSGWAGVDDPMFGRITAAGARLTTSHVQSIGIAEYVLAGVLDILQRGPERRAAQAAGRWEVLPFREIHGSDWLVVGFGAIGQAVAERARAFGARVTGVRRDPAAHPLADRIAALEDVPALAPHVDVVVLCCPLTSATRGLADAGFFARLKPGAIFMNVGRGDLADEAALLAALDAGTLAHAVLDVFAVEPLPPESRLWKHPRVSLTAHAAGITDGYAARNDEVFFENLARYREGRPLARPAAV